MTVPPGPPKTSSQKTSKQRPRTCVQCREEAPKRALLRLVRSPEGTVLIDERGKLPGRGAYLCARQECLEKVRKSNALGRALKTAIPDELYRQLSEYIATYREKHGEADIRRELRSLLGLMRRAGLITIGIDSVKSQCEAVVKVKEANMKEMKEKDPLMILTAADASASVRDAVHRQVEKTGFLHKVVPLNVDAFSAAMGAAGVQVIALPVRNGLTDKIKLLLE